MNFQQLEYILAVDQHKHFAKAANYCHVTQATLSGMIKKLEEEVGIVIFDRSRQPIKTTDEGLQIIALARQILQLQNNIHQIKSESSQEPSGLIRLGIIPTIANSVLPIILPPLLSKYADLELEIVEITTDEIIRQMKADQIDAGILATPLSDELIEENIMYYEAMMVYGVKKSNRKYVAAGAIQNQKVWLLEEGNCFRNQAVTICDIKESTKGYDNLKFEGSSFETLLNLTDQFGGYTLIPELYYKQLSEERKSKTRPFEKPMPVREISLVYYRPYARKRTLDLLSEEISTLLKGEVNTSEMKAKDLEIVGI